MPAPVNLLKQRLARGETVFGCWLGMAEPYLAEMAGTAGFDWLLIDGEHAPNDIRSLGAQLAVLAGSASSPIVRLPVAAAMFRFTSPSIASKGLSTADATFPKEVFEMEPPSSWRSASCAALRARPSSFAIGFISRVFAAR